MQGIQSRLLHRPIQQLMLPFHPVFHHTAEIAWPQNLYYGAEGKDIDEKLRFICGIIVNGAQPVFAFFTVFRMLFVAGKVKHTAFKRVPFSGYF